MAHIYLNMRGGPDFSMRPHLCHNFYNTVMLLLVEQANMPPYQVERIQQMNDQKLNMHMSIICSLIGSMIW